MNISPEVAQKMLAVLKNVELLIRINHPMNDGCEMHKDVKSVLALAETKTEPEGKRYYVQSYHVRGERRQYSIVDRTGKNKNLPDCTTDKTLAEIRCFKLNKKTK